MKRKLTAKPQAPDLDRAVEAIENRLRKVAPMISVRKSGTTKRKQ